MLKLRYFVLFMIILLGYKMRTFPCVHHGSTYSPHSGHCEAVYSETAVMQVAFFFLRDRKSVV